MKRPPNMMNVLCLLVLIILFGNVAMQIRCHITFHRFRALLSADESRQPATIEIIANGKRAVFRRHAESYNRLLKILQSGTSESAFHQAGPFQASLDAKTQYGELVIYQYGLSSHFTILRSTRNGNYFWIRVPHADGTGYHLPLFALGSNFVDLVSSGSSEISAEHSVPPNPRSPAAHGFGGR